MKDGDIGSCREALKKYILLGFAPADDPQVIALITIDEPVGIYYGGTIAAPVVADIFSNILPYLDITFASRRINIEPLCAFVRM